MKSNFRDLSVSFFEETISVGGVPKGTGLNILNIGINYGEAFICTNNIPVRVDKPNNKIVKAAIMAKIGNQLDEYLKMMEDRFEN